MDVDEQVRRAADDVPDCGCARVGSLTAALRLERRRPSTRRLCASHGQGERAAVDRGFATLYLF